MRERTSNIVEARLLIGVGPNLGRSTATKAVSGSAAGLLDAMGIGKSYDNYTMNSFLLTHPMVVFSPHACRLLS